MYQALYRKWRPKTFNDVVGQEHISETLKRQIVTDRLSHAYLFVGTRGTGKTSCAKILSKAINCRQPENGNPCNKCASCVGIENGSILDVLELDAASNNGVDNVRALREEAVFTPADVKKRVYIIDEVHMLSTAAFNALLKILEEPPEHLVFILATTEIHKVPATILSRCQRFTFKRILPEKIAGRLQDIAGREGITLTGDAAQLLARLSDGSLRDALSLLDQCASESAIDYDHVISAIGLAGSTEIAGMLSAIAENDVTHVLDLLDKLYIGGKVMASVLEELMNLVRDVLITALMPTGGAGHLSGGFDQAVLQGFTQRFTPDRLLSVMDVLRETTSDLSKSSGGKLAVELCFIRLCDKRLSGDLPSMLSRIAALEDKFSGGFIPASARPVEPKVTPSAPEPYKAGIRETTPPAEKAPAAQPAAAVTNIPAAPKAPVPELRQTSEKGTDGDIWDGVLAHIKACIDEPQYRIIAEQITASVDGNTLVLSSKTPFGINYLNKQEISTAIREAIPRVAGMNLTLRIVQENASSGGATDKLDALSRFSNIKFE